MNEGWIRTLKFYDRKAAERMLADEIKHVILNAIRRNGEAKLVVSGGSTPVGLFRLLSRNALPWHRVIITLTDDRMLPPDHPDSNSRLINGYLLQNRAQTAHFLPLCPVSFNTDEAAKEGNWTVQDLGRTDAVILGMGSDGHTASLFPGSRDLDLGLNMDSGRHCIEVTPPSAPYKRLTQTLPALLNTGHLFVHFYGQSKFNVFASAQEYRQPEVYPISAFLHQRVVPVSVFYAD